MNGRLLTCVFTSSLLCINAYAVEPDESASVSEQAITAVTESTETDTEVNVEANSEVINQGLAPKAESKSSQILQKLIKLVAESKFALAYQTGLSIHNEWEGDESFDFNFALAAAQTGHYNRAIFPFERLLENNPNNNRYRLELARCHFFLNNYHAAQREFNLVLASNPPAEVQAHIDRFLTRIAEQKQQVNQSWNAGAGIALGYDSNINAAADLDAIEATFYDNGVPALRGALTLDDEQKSQGSNYYQVQGYGQYLQPISKRSSIDATLSTAKKDNSIDDTYDLTNLALKGGFRLLRGSHSMRLGASFRQYWLASEVLQNQLLADVNWQWHFAPNLKTSTEFELGQQDNEQNDALDFLQWQAKFSVHRNVEGFSQKIHLGLGADKADSSKNNFQGRDYYSLGYQAQQKLTASQQMYALVNYRNNSYADSFSDEHIFFAGKTRDDQLIQGIAGWVFNVISNTSVKVQISHSQNKSNLELYDYQRTLIETGLAISFK